MGRYFEDLCERRADTEPSYTGPGGSALPLGAFCPRNRALDDPRRDEETPRVPANSTAPSWRPYALLSLLWCVAAIAAKPFYPYVDFAAFYANAIERILGGAPLDIYSFVARP